MAKYKTFYGSENESEGKLLDEAVSEFLEKLEEEGHTLIRVNTITLDAFCMASNIRPDGIKIDVEGAEGQVFEGAKEVIRIYSPWILLEFHAYSMSSEVKERVWRLVTENAKRVTFIEEPKKEYPYGIELHSMPKCDIFHIFIQY